jgi:hypothetical protein
VSSYKFKRRAFLASIGAAAGLKSWLLSAEAAAAGVTPKRYMRIHRGVGTIYRNWFLAGMTAPAVETQWTATRILSKFDAVRSHMAVLQGIDIQKGVGGHHESYSVVMTTGQTTKTLWPGNGGDDPKPEGPSFDQEILRTTPAMKRAIPSLQLSVDDRVEGNEYSCRRLAYLGAGDAGIAPTNVPRTAYDQLRTQLSQGGQTQADWERLKAEKKSVLDFVKSDLTRLKTLAPASERARIDAHADALRTIENRFATPPASDACAANVTAPPATLSGIRQADVTNGIGSAKAGDDVRSAEVGAAHLDVVRAAFQCDLTRVVNFLWSPGTSCVGFGGFKNVANAVRAHHDVSHTDGGNTDGQEFLTRIEEFYAQHTAAFLLQLKNTPDPADPNGGSLLDNTFVFYSSEEGEGLDHKPENVPIAIFGGKGVKVRGGIYKKFGGWNGNGKPNNIYMTAIKALELNMTTFGDPAWCASGPLDILTA